MGRDLIMIVYMLTWKFRSWLSCECLYIAMKACPKGAQRDLLVLYIDTFLWQISSGERRVSRGQDNS